jgi:hypothetical protein
MLKRLFLIAGIIFLLTEAGAVSETQGATFPHGIYWVGPPRKPVPPAVLQNRSVRGVLLRAPWQHIELREGSYDWSYFDVELERAGSSGKEVALLIASGGWRTPDWIMDLDQVQKFSFIDQNPYHKETVGKEVTIPVLWDPVYLEKKKQMIRAWGNRYGKNPHVVTVRISCADSMTDWGLPTRTPLDIQNWKTIGYSPDKLIRACKEILDTAMAVFPGKVIALGIGGIRLDKPPTLVAESVVDYAFSKYPGRFMVMLGNLSARTPLPAEEAPHSPWKILYDRRPNTGAQMLWFVTGDKTFRMNGKKPDRPEKILQESLQTGIEYGLSLIEVYEADLLNPVFSAIIEQAASQMEKRG